MKIKCLTIQGFRGFKKEQTIDFHEHLTLLYAPNSYGKTSISEALEWLLYGVTSKVEKADSKEEYRGSYRNRHLPEELIPFVRVCFSEQGGEIIFRGELRKDDTERKLVGEGVSSAEVDEWPLPQDYSDAPRPFILQHALKYLLLTTPDDRFKGFARLLGLEALDTIQRNIISLCYAPDRKIPREVKELQNRVSSLETRLANCPALSSLQKVLKRKTVSIEDIAETIKQEGRKKVPPETGDDAVFSQLLKIREDAVGKVFKERITLPEYSGLEKQQNSEDEDFFATCITETFVKEYTELIVLTNYDQLQKRARFFGLGIEFLQGSPQTCPFCNQPLDEKLAEHIQSEHGTLVEQTKSSEGLEKQRTRVSDALDALKKRLVAYHNRHTTRVQTLLGVKNSLQELKTLLVPKHELVFQKLEIVLSVLSPKLEQLVKEYESVIANLDAVILSIDISSEDLDVIHPLGETLLHYISTARDYAETISERTQAITEVDQVLQRELDVLAGTEDISLLVELYDQRSAIKKKFEIDSIIGNIKELRKSTEKYVSNRVLRAVTGELTAEVMEWYEQIKTTGDPDVHFDGFDMERAQNGELKARRVRIKAKSYGEELVSAVSSLSESKLNALGLCVSIASNLKGQSPFEFLIIDDPIQSLDTEHEVRFIQVIRSLVEKSKKQVVVLSHNKKWLEQVCEGCRSLNGVFYEITGYTQDGPCISQIDWEKWRERLKVVNAILEDPNAGTVLLQQAEEEIRLTIPQITSELYRKKRGIVKSPHSLNSSQVERMLIECGVERGLVDRIVQTFSTTDDSHHPSEGYCPDRERIRQYHSWTHELAKLLN